MTPRARLLALVALLAAGASAAQAQCQPAIRQLNAERRYAESKAQMQAAVAKAPNDDAAWECLGLIAVAMERPGEGKEYFEKAIKINDKVATHHLQLGNALGDLADSTSKIKLPFLARRIKGEFEKTVALDPNNVDGRYGLVEFYTQAPGVMGGSREKAQEQINEILKLNPMRGHLKQGELYARDKKDAEAEKEYVAAEEAAPDSALTGYTLANFYEARRRWNDAFGVYDRMEKRLPAEWSVRFRIGRVAALSGERLERGEKELRAFIASPPPGMNKQSQAAVHHRLGQILERQGKKDQARAEYTTALSIDPNSQNAKKSLAALK